MASFAEPKASPRGRVQVLNNSPSLGPNIRITPQARYYAVAELTAARGNPARLSQLESFRRAGTHDLRISNGTRKFITFPHASPKLLKALAAGQLSSVNVFLTNPIAGAGAGYISHCVVPFVASELEAERPLFYLVDENHLECALDLPLSILLSLSCWEEILESPRIFTGGFRRKTASPAPAVFWSGRSSMNTGWRSSSRCNCCSPRGKRRRERRESS